MDLQQVGISTSGPANRLDSLPYRDQLLSIERDGTCLRIVTIQPSNDLCVSTHAAGIELDIDGRRYQAALPVDHTLHIKTGNGNDRITVQTGADSQVVLETAEGNDEIHLRHAPGASNGGYVVVDAGPGNDSIVVEGGQDVEIDGGAGNDFIASRAAQSMLHAGTGNDELKIDDGRANLEALAGSNRITSGALDTRIYGNREAITAIDGFDAPLLFEPQQARLPASYARIFDIKGDSHYVEKVTRQLEMLRASPAASVLLADLLAINARVEIAYTPVLDNAFADFDRSQGDPKVRNGQRGDRIRNCKVIYNPLTHRPGTPSLVMLYHELCHVWNFATGSVIGNGERQAVGLDTGQAPFDFDDDPNTPAIDTNPKPFNENALRHELGLPPRTQYP